MAKWLCKCGFIFDEEKGFPSKNIKPGTKFEDINAFSCPKCGGTRRDYGVIKPLDDDSTVPHIQARYDRMKEWVMDPRGYFTIKPFPKEGLIKVRYYSADGRLRSVIEGRTAMDIYNTLIRENMISSLQHAADMGAELMKAEIAMKRNLEYIQDGPLRF